MGGARVGVGRLGGKRKKRTGGESGLGGPQSTRSIKKDARGLISVVDVRALELNRTGGKLLGSDARAEMDTERTRSASVSCSCGCKSGPNLGAEMRRDGQRTDRIYVCGRALGRGFWHHGPKRTKADELGLCVGVGLNAHWSALVRSGSMSWLFPLLLFSPHRVEPWWSSSTKGQNSRSRGAMGSMEIDWSRWRVYGCALAATV